MGVSRFYKIKYNTSFGSPPSLTSLDKYFSRKVSHVLKEDKKKDPVILGCTQIF
jgi:hypothetical protein